MSYVLVVEDDPLGADAAGEFLGSLGHPVRVVATPALALGLMAWSRPDVVLADLGLPRYADQALQAACEYLVIPLLDLASTICLMGRTDRRRGHAALERLSEVGSV